MKLTPEDMMRTNDAPPLELFNQGMRTEATRRRYTDALRKILCEFLEDMLEGTLEERAEQLVKHGRDDPLWARDLMISLVRKFRERSNLDKDDPNYLNPASFANYLKPLKKLLDMNDVTLSWARVYSTCPEPDNLPDTRGWTREEIARMLVEARGPMERALVLVLASSGVRAGALDPLNWGDLAPVYRVGDKLTMDSGDERGELACSALTVYRGSAESYTTFITPEAFEALQDYGRVWSGVMGRQAGSDDPMFLVMRGSPVRASPQSLRDRVRMAVKNAGLRDGGKRVKKHGVPLMNGFRRFYNKTCKNVKSGDSSLGSLIRKEYMMGHRGLTNLDENYFKTDVLELAAEYVAAVPDLTIDDADRLRLSNRRLSDNLRKAEGEKDVELARMKKEMARMKEEMTLRDGEIEDLKNSRGQSGTDLVDALRDSVGADGVPGSVVESLTEMMRRMEAAHKADFDEFRKTVSKELREEYDAKIAKITRDLEASGRKSLR